MNKKNNKNKHNNKQPNDWAIISKIVESSFIDGPGHRMVVFFQGCNLKCIYCHNPETTGICKSCFKCISSCPSKALTLTPTLTLTTNNKQIIAHNQQLCLKCDLCLKVCPNHSSPLCYKITIEQLINRIESEKNFIDGITLSGGEATLYSDFIFNLFSKIKARSTLNMNMNMNMNMNLSLFIDTNGYNKKSVFDKLSSVTDGFIFDLKAFDPKIHKKLTGKDNETILKNIKLISEKKLLYEIRTVFIEGINDSKEEISSIVNFIKRLNDYTIFKLTPFRPQGVVGDLKNHAPYPQQKLNILIEESCKILGGNRVRY
ncbi:MAG: YjjW family glycine radical enzyme activase [Oligoflexia bacterium]|nr:YjjW family glycine radical enzyme activase [Oligoflexia bacterium]